MGAIRFNSVALKVAVESRQAAWSGALATLPPPVPPAVGPHIAERSWFVAVIVCRPLEFLNLPNGASASGCVGDQRRDLPLSCEQLSSLVTAERPSTAPRRPGRSNCCVDFDREGSLHDVGSQLGEFLLA